MDRPLVWSALDQAAEWLSNKTGSKWNREKIISFSIEQYHDENKEKKDEYFHTVKDGKRVRKMRIFSKEDLAITRLPPSPTYLSAKIPRSIKAGIYKYKNDIEEHLASKYESIPGGLFRWADNVDIRFAPLYLNHLKYLFCDNETEINQPLIKFIPKCGWEYGLFYPIKSLTPEEVKSLESYSRSCNGYLPHDAIVELGESCLVTVDMAGITKENLEKLLLDYKKTSHSTEEAEITSKSYTTKEMNVLEEAKREFWENHDPDRPPKKEVVVEWLRERGISKRIAIAMDTILRSPAARIGGNKPSTLKSK